MDDTELAEWCERLQHPRHTAALDAALIDVRDALYAGNPASATAWVLENVVEWRHETLAATLAMVLVRLAKAEAVEVTL